MGLTATVQGDSEPVLEASWQPDPCASGHQLQYELTRTGKYDAVARPENVSVSLAQSVTSHRVDGLLNCAEYNVYIHPQYDDTLGPSSSKLTLQTPRGDGN